MMQHKDKIVRDAVRYVEDYIAFKKQDLGCIAVQEYNRRYRFSTLPYFDDILIPSEK